MTETLSLTGQHSALHPLLEKASRLIVEQGLTVVKEDFERPWGGFYVFADSDAEAFRDRFFGDVHFDSYEGLTPKFLFPLPGKRLLWQTHARRAEHWYVVEGPVGAKISSTPVEPNDVRILASGETISMDTGVTHRLIGLGQPGMIAEIWQHTHPAFPSDEENIVRHQDDYAR